MIVMDEDNCMVDFARFFLSFLEDESCGLCIPCREGIPQMRQIHPHIGAGKATGVHLDLLKELAEVVVDASLCQLGTTAPNPVLTTLAYFRDEDEVNIREGRCPAGVCKCSDHVPHRRGEMHRLHGLRTGSVLRGPSEERRNARNRLRARR